MVLFVITWEQCKLSQLAEFNPKSELPNEFNYVDLESVLGTELLGHRLESKESAPSRAQRLAKKGDLFFQTVRPYQKNNYLFDLPHNNFVFSTGYAQLRPRINGYFLLSRVQEENFVNEVLERCTGTSYPAISSSDLADIEIFTPKSRIEQDMIGDTFMKIDNLITLHQRKYEKLKNIKNAILQKMFPKEGNNIPEIRFKGFTDAWEQCELGSCVDVTTGKLDANAMVIDGEFDFYTSGIAKYRIDNFAFEGPAITIAGNGATVGYMHLADGKFNAYQRTYVLTNFKSDRLFTFRAISQKLPKKISNEARTGNIPYIVMDMLTKLDITIPNIEEQTKIGSIFNSVDNLITLHQRKHEKLKNIKKALLEKMFV